MWLKQFVELRQEVLPIWVLILVEHQMMSYRVMVECVYHLSTIIAIIRGLLPTLDYVNAGYVFEHGDVYALELLFSGRLSAFTLEQQPNSVIQPIPHGDGAIVLKPYIKEPYAIVLLNLPDDFDFCAVVCMSLNSYVFFFRLPSSLSIASSVCNSLMRRLWSCRLYGFVSMSLYSSRTVSCCSCRCRL